LIFPEFSRCICRLNEHGDGDSRPRFGVLLKWGADLRETAINRQLDSSSERCVEGEEQRRSRNLVGRAMALHGWNLISKLSRCVRRMPHIVVHDAAYEPAGRARSDYFE